MQTQPAARLNEVIAGKYRIEGVLGTGGMGVVFAATQLDLDRLVAVKVIRAELTEHPGAVQRLVQEAKLAAQFRSEHVCKVLDVGTLSDGSPYIVMEHLDGSDLAALLVQHGQFSIDMAVDFMLEACEALAEAHTAEVVHRDLKPENLFVAKLPDGSPTIKVLDFGISKRVGITRTASRALTNPSAALGSPHYMAPEQMRAAKDVDCRADLWALGAILFELLSARPAFEGDTVPEVCGAVMSATPKRVSELRPDVPERLSDVVARCLEKDPAARYANVAELAAALVPFGSAKAPASLKRIHGVFSGRAKVRVVSSPTSPSVEPRRSAPTEISDSLAAMARSARRRRQALWAAAAALLVGLVAAIALALRSGAAAEPLETTSLPAARPPSVPAALPAPPTAAASPTAAALPTLAPAVPAAPTVGAHAPTAVSARPAPQANAPSAAVVKPRPAQVQARPVPAPIATVSAAPRNDKATQSTEAWDTTNFGPRR